MAKKTFCFVFITSMASRFVCLVFTLIQKAKDHGSVMMTKRALTPVRKTAQGPGLVGSAKTENLISLLK